MLSIVTFRVNEQANDNCQSKFVLTVYTRIQSVKLQERKTLLQITQTQSACEEQQQLGSLPSPRIVAVLAYCNYCLFCSKAVLHLFILKSFNQTLQADRWSSALVVRGGQLQHSF